MAVATVLKYSNLESESQSILKAGAVQQVIFPRSVRPAGFNLEGGRQHRSSDVQSRKWWLVPSRNSYLRSRDADAPVAARFGPNVSSKADSCCNIVDMVFSMALLRWSTGSCDFKGQSRGRAGSRLGNVTVLCISLLTHGYPDGCGRGNAFRLIVNYSGSAGWGNSANGCRNNTVTMGVKVIILVMAGERAFPPFPLRTAWKDSNAGA